jgi:uncharacterized protein (TIGR01244 family)
MVATYMVAARWWPSLKGISPVVEIRKLDESVSVAGQPTEADFAEFARLGFRSVINNRPDGEDGAPGTETEALWAAKYGLEYRHLPMTAASLAPQTVSDFGDALEDMPGPVLAHCRSGTRCSILWSIDAVGRRQEAVEDVLETTAGAGYDLSGQLPFILHYARQD